MTTTTTRRTERARKLTVEERRSLYATNPPGNKYMEAFKKTQGTITNPRKPAKDEEAGDEKYSLRPFTIEELNARLDQAEANIAAGYVIDDENVWAELEEEFAREDAEEDTRRAVSHVENEQFAMT